jgi:hypothetical protein
VAGGLALGLVVVLAALGAMPGIGEALPAQLLDWGGQIVAGTGETYWPAVWVSLGLVVGALLGAWIFLERQEL